MSVLVRVKPSSHNTFRISGIEPKSTFINGLMQHKLTQVLSLKAASMLTPQ